MTQLAAWYRRHYWFGVLLLLFFAMRMLAILLFRPGGFFADNSDYDFYQLWGWMGQAAIPPSRTCGQPTRRCSRR